MTNLVVGSPWVRIRLLPELRPPLFGPRLAVPTRKRNLSVPASYTEVRAASSTGNQHSADATTEPPFNRSRGRKSILKIADIDSERCVLKSVEAMLDNLTWLGFNRDEGSLRPQGQLISPAVAKWKNAGEIRSETVQFLTKRRGALLRIFLASISLPCVATNASAEIDLQESFRTYEDETNKYFISIPKALEKELRESCGCSGKTDNVFRKFAVKNWIVGAGDGNGFKSVTAFFPEGSSDSNGIYDSNVVITGLGPDFTRLESFGNVDAFAETLIGGLDRSWQRPPGVKAKLINSKAANGLYYIEYSLQNPGEKSRHILTALGVASNGWYNRLYTVTGQYMDDEAEKYQPQIMKVVSSFRFM